MEMSERLEIQATALPGLFVLTLDGGAVALYKGTIPECDAAKETLERYGNWVASKIAPPTNAELIALGECAISGRLDFESARGWFANWLAGRVLGGGDA